MAGKKKKKKSPIEENNYASLLSSTAERDGDAERMKNVSARIVLSGGFVWQKDKERGGKKRRKLERKIAIKSGEKVK